MNNAVFKSTPITAESLRVANIEANDAAVLVYIFGKQNNVYEATSGPSGDVVISVTDKPLVAGLGYRLKITNANNEVQPFRPYGATGSYTYNSAQFSTQGVTAVGSATAPTTATLELIS